MCVCGCVCVCVCVCGCVCVGVCVLRMVYTEVLLAQPKLETIDLSNAVSRLFYHSACLYTLCMCVHAEPPSGG